MTAVILKLIASICMLIDHTGLVFSSYTPHIFRCIGRTAFPIYAFFLAHGCRYTKDMDKYIRRLFLFALISEIPFDLAHFAAGLINSSGEGFAGYINFLKSTNVIYTLCFSAVCIYVLQKIREKTMSLFLGICLIAPVIAMGDILGTDYGSFGIIWIILLYMAHTKSWQLFVLFGGIFYEYLLPLIEYMIKYRRVYFPDYFLFSLAALALLLFYNGEKSRSPVFTDSKAGKWLFYMFYPSHLLALAIIAIALQLA